MKLGWAWAGAFGLGMMSAGGVHAVTPEEDEARIEVLVRAEHEAAAQRAQEAATADTSSPDAVPVAAVVKAYAPSVAGGNDDWLAERSAEAGAPFAELAQHIGDRVSIVTRGDRRHSGVIRSANARQVTLGVRRRGGDATYTLRRDQVLRIEFR